MDRQHTAEEVLEAVGGRSNVLANTICMTRLRLSVNDPSLVDQQRLCGIRSVLGIARRGDKGVEVVFGPAIIDEVYRDFVGLTGLRGTVGAERLARPVGDSMRIQISPGRQKSYSAQAAAFATMLEKMPGRPEATRDPLGDGDLQASAASGTDEAVDVDDASRLRQIFSEVSGDDDPSAGPADGGPTGDPEGPRLLVINGANINMLGIREPDVYGHESYAALVGLCQRAAEGAGFSRCRCYQSNHEGDLVDEIQRAWKAYDGIVINPGAYTHTSVAILDALKAVRIPAVEVHVSKVDEREDFRQVSFVRAACFETIAGEGIAGYAHAIRDLAARLSSEGAGS